MLNTGITCKLKNLTYKLQNENSSLTISLKSYVNIDHFQNGPLKNLA